MSNTFAKLPRSELSPAELSPAEPSPAAAQGASGAGLIDGVYAVNTSQPLPGAGGSLAAFAATDRSGARTGLMAVQVRSGAPPRAAALTALAGMTVPGLLAPLACGPAPAGDGRVAWFVVCPAPSGPALWPDATPPPAPWSEAALIHHVLLPAAAALAALQARGVTHRAIRPNNLFRSATAPATTLGCAWASPPALLQPAVFEPPYMAMCPPAARGDGCIADDVYALGVSMLALFTGRVPLADLDDEAVILRKLELGCFAALTAGTRLPSLIAELLGGILADDPQHRPPPALLADPATVRGRGGVVQRARRASRALLVDECPAWNARMAAFAVSRRPVAAARTLRLGVVDHWLRRSLGDVALAARLEGAVQQRIGDFTGADASVDSWTVMRAVALLDPLAPLCWNGLALWPDGVAGVLAMARDSGEAAHGKLTGLVAGEVCAGWAAARGGHTEPATLRMDARAWRSVLRERGWAGGLSRLCYALNPLLPCRSPLVAVAAVARLGDLLPALEAAAPQPGTVAAPPIDRELAAFIAARGHGTAMHTLTELGDGVVPDVAALLQLRLLAPLQAELGAAALPRLAGWLATCAAPLLAGWRNLKRRADKQQSLAEVAAAGNLASVLAMFDSRDERAEDERAYQEALAAARHIDGDIAAVRASASARLEIAHRLGQEIAAAVAFAALAACAVAAALG